MNTKKELQKYLRQLQSEGQFKRIENATTDFNWADAFAKLEKEFAEGESHVFLNVSGSLQRECVAKELRRPWFDVHDYGDPYMLSVSLKPTLKQRITYGMKSTGLKLVSGGVLMAVGLGAGFVSMVAGVAFIVLGVAVFSWGLARLVED